VAGGSNLGLLASGSSQMPATQKIPKFKMPSVARVSSDYALKRLQLKNGEGSEFVKTKGEPLCGDRMALVRRSAHLSSLFAGHSDGSIQDP